MTVDELGQQTKAKHPEYGSLSDSEVGARVLSKYPEYRPQIGSDTSSKGSGFMETVGDAASSIPALEPIHSLKPEIPKGNALEQVLGSLKQVASFPMRFASTYAELPNALGEGATELGGRYGYPKTGAGVGTAISVLGPMAMGPAGESRILKPTVPLAKRGAVSAAQEFGIPLTRAEQTGSRFTEGLESGLEKTPFGTIPINKFREAQITAKQAALQKVKGEMGTPSDMFEVGQRAKEGYGSEMGQARDLRDELYSQVPSDIKVPLNNSIDTADQIIKEQSQYLPTTRNADVVSMARDIQNAQGGISSGEGVTGGPEVRGITNQIADKRIPSSTKTIKSSLVGERGQPLSFQETTPGKVVKGGPEYGVQHSVSPETSFPDKPNYPLLSRLRSTLGDKITANTIVKADGTSSLTQAGRDFMRLKAALDKDIEGYASSPASPLESMTAKEFKRSYGEATANAKGFAETYQNPEVKRLAMTDPEKIVNSIFKKNSETDINRFRKAVGEGPFQMSKKRFTQDLLESKNIKGELSKYEPGTLRAIYDKEELTKLNKLGDAFDLIQYAEKTAGNPSGTGRVVTGAGSFGAAGYALKARRPDVAAAILGIPYLAAKEYINTSGGVPISGLTQRAARSASISGSRKK